MRIEHKRSLSSKKFAFKEEDSEATESIGSHEETKNKPIPREKTPFIYYSFRLKLFFGKF